MDYPLHRPPDFDYVPETYGWNSPRVKRILGGFLGGEVVSAQKAVADSTSGGPLIVQGVESRLYATFLKKFPLYDMFRKEEANGLVHAYRTQTAYSQKTTDQPATMSENAVVTDDSNTYGQATTNIAIFGERRGSSLKAQFANRQGIGSFGDLPEVELEGGLTKIAQSVSAEIGRMQNTNAAAVTATHADGLYDANGFNGLRYILKNISPAGNTIAVNVSGAITGQPVSTAIRDAADVVLANGGTPDLIIGSVNSRRYAINEMLPFVRIDMQRSTEVIPGLTVPAFVASNGELPFVAFPGDSPGTYTTGGTTSFQDIYVLDSSTISLPWLGGPTPTVLDIQIGADGTLRKLYIPFLMVGFAVHQPGWVARVQLQTSA